MFTRFVYTFHTDQSKAMDREPHGQYEGPSLCSANIIVFEKTVLSGCGIYVSIYIHEILITIEITYFKNFMNMRIRVKTISQVRSLSVRTSWLDTTATNLQSANFQSRSRRFPNGRLDAREGCVGVAGLYRLASFILIIHRHYHQHHHHSHLDT